MAAYLPKFAGTQPVTFIASADVTGGRLVSITGPRMVGPSGADSALVAGVAGFDVDAGSDLTVYPRPAGTHPLVASGAIAAGANVISAVGGKVATLGGGSNAIGIALKSASADGDVIDVEFI